MTSETMEAVQDTSSDKPIKLSDFRSLFMVQPSVYDGPAFMFVGRGQVVLVSTSPNIDSTGMPNMHNIVVRVLGESNDWYWVVSKTVNAFMLGDLINHVHTIVEQYVEQKVVPSDFFALRSQFAKNGSQSPSVDAFGEVAQTWNTDPFLAGFITDDLLENLRRRERRQQSSDLFEEVAEYVQCTEMEQRQINEWIDEGIDQTKNLVEIGERWEEVDSEHSVDDVENAMTHGNDDHPLVEIMLNHYETLKNHLDVMLDHVSSIDNTTNNGSGTDGLRDSFTEYTDAVESLIASVHDLKRLADEAAHDVHRQQG